MKKVIKELKIDKVIHERARLLIMTVVASRPDKKIGFNDLKDISQLTSGNLSIQLKKLEEEDYLKIVKGYKGNRPYTEIELTEKGKRALEEYLEEMEKILKIYRGEV
jgi:DNA-binding MarR family transcriptional regulator